MKNIFGCATGKTKDSGKYFDVSLSLRATKRWATMNGHAIVYCRFNSGYNIEAVAVKKDNGKWLDLRG